MCLSRPFRSRNSQQHVSISIFLSKKRYVYVLRLDLLLFLSIYKNIRYFAATTILPHTKGNRMIFSDKNGNSLLSLSFQNHKIQKLFVNLKSKIPKIERERSWNRFQLSARRIDDVPRDSIDDNQLFSKNSNLEILKYLLPFKWEDYDKERDRETFLQ